MGNDNLWVGNSNWWWDKKPVPASWSTVIGVGATDSDRLKAGYSNWGPEVDIWAPAGDYHSSTGATPERIRTALNRGKACYPQVLRCADVANELSEFSGTSAAAPFVAGAIALMKQVNPSLNRAQVQDILQRTSYKNLGANGSNVVNDSGGLINVYAAVYEARRLA